MNFKDVLSTLEGVQNFDTLYSDMLINYFKNVDTNAKAIFFSGVPASGSITNRLATYNADIKTFADTLIIRIAGAVSENNLNNTVISTETIQTDLVNWLSNHNSTVGVTAAVVTLNQILPQAFNEVADTAESMRVSLTDETVITGICAYDQTDTKHQLLRLLWTLFKSLDESKCTEATNYWNQHGYGEFLNNIADYKWLEILKSAINPDSSCFGEFRDAVRTAVQKEIWIRDENRSVVVDVGPTGAPIVQQYTDSHFMQSTEVFNWMKGTGLNYLTGSEPNYQERIYTKTAPAPSGCVTADTAIFMKDGSLKPISEISDGDEVLNADGTYSVCSGEVILNEHVSCLYSVNDEKPFMSLDHLVLTASGYKCLDPKTAVALNPHLKVSLLHIGDVLVKYKNGEKCFEVVNKINHAQNKELCADIHISDGRKSYVTENGYICFANYPEITTKSVLNNISPLAEDFSKFLKENETMLKQSFGEHAYSYISMISDVKNLSADNSKNSSPCTYEFISSMQQTNYAINSEKPIGFEKMSIIRGFAFFGNDTPVPLKIKNGKVYWKTADSSGYLKVYDRGLFCKGHIISNGEKTDFTAGASNRYDMTLVPKDGGSNIDFGYFIMEMKSFGFFTNAYGGWHMTNESGYDCENAATDTGEIAYSIDTDTYLLKTTLFQFRYSNCPAVKNSSCSGGEFLFTPLFDSLSGTATRNSGKEEIGTFNGTLHISQVNECKRLADIIAEYLQSGRTNETDLTEDEITSLEKGYSKSVQDLARLPVPDMNTIHSQSFNRMLNMAVYAAYEKNDDSVARLGLPKPIVGGLEADITQKQADVANANSNFLINKFISAYLSYSYIKRGNSPDCPADVKKNIQPILDIDGGFDKVYYYMQGNGPDCMPSSAEYTAVTNATYSSVYLNNVIGLDDYVDDNPKDWAKQFYAALNFPATLLGLVSMQAVQSDNALLLHYYSMLDVLDPDTKIPIVDSSTSLFLRDDEPKTYSYATVLRKQVMDASLKWATDNVLLPDKDDKDAVELFENYISEFFTTFIKGIHDGTFSNWTTETYNEMIQDIQDMADAYNFKTIEEMVEDISVISADVTAAILSIDNPDMPSKLRTFYQNHPRISSFATLGFYGCGIAALYFGFKNYSSLTPAEKASLYLDLATISVSALNDISIIASIKVFKSGMGDIIEADKLIMTSMKKADYVDFFRGSKSVETFIIESGVDISKCSTGAATFFTKFTRFSGNVAKGLGVLAIAVSLGIGIYGLVEDIKNGESPGILVLDSLMIISDCVVLVAEVFLSSIPIVGFVAAIIGIVLAFISMFIKKKEPEDPMLTFVKTRLVAFINSLPEVDQEWLKKHLNPDDDINKLIRLFETPQPRLSYLYA